MELTSLTYSSRAVGTLDDAEVERIVHSAKVNNSMDGVSGFLLFNGVAFLQVLEGVGNAIDEVMARIVNDPRHRDIEIVDRRVIEQRAFPDWTMGFLRLSGDTSNVEAIERALRRDTPAPVKQRLLEMAATLKSYA